MLFIHKLYTSIVSVLEQIMKDVIPTCQECNGVVKPDIVFFGEQLPDKFYTCLINDFKMCDLLIIMGTSLTVQPFASLVDRYFEENCPKTNIQSFLNAFYLYYISLCFECSAELINRKFVRFQSSSYHA